MTNQEKYDNAFTQTFALEKTQLHELKYQGLDA